jgi:hypothetical protein
VWDARCLLERRDRKVFHHKHVDLHTRWQAAAYPICADIDRFIRLPQIRRNFRAAFYSMCDGYFFLVLRY